MPQRRPLLWVSSSVPPRWRRSTTLCGHDRRPTVPRLASASSDRSTRVRRVGSQTIHPDCGRLPRDRRRPTSSGRGGLDCRGERRPLHLITILERVSRIYGGTISRGGRGGQARPHGNSGRGRVHLSRRCLSRRCPSDDPDHSGQRRGKCARQGRVARRGHPDGGSGRSGLLRRVFLGDVSYRIVHGAEVPLRGGAPQFGRLRWPRRHRLPPAMTCLSSSGVHDRSRRLHHAARTSGRPRVDVLTPALYRRSPATMLGRVSCEQEAQAAAQRISEVHTSRRPDRVWLAGHSRGGQAAAMRQPIR